MNEFDFYKEYYFYELKRKDDLYNMINIPLLIITAIISIHIYLFKYYKNFKIISVEGLFVAITFLLICLTVFYLVNSYSNKLKAHSYKEIAGMNDLYQYKKQLSKEKESSFYEDLKEKLAECSQHNFEINKNRTEQIAKAKIFLILSIASTLIFIFITIIKFVMK